MKKLFLLLAILALPLHAEDFFGAFPDPTTALGPGTATVDNEEVLWSGTTGTRIKRGTGTGYCKATSGVRSYVTTLPRADRQLCSANEIEQMNAGGTAWTCAALASGVNTVAYSDTANSTGGSISGATLTLRAGDASNPGLVSTTTQEIVGAKFFQAIRPYVTGTSTIGLSGQYFLQTYSRYFTAGTNGAGSLITDCALDHGAWGNYCLGYYGADATGWYFSGWENTVPAGGTLNGLKIHFKWDNYVTTVSAPDDAVNNATAARGFVFRGANKTAGTGDGGPTTIDTGTSAGGNRGAISFKTGGVERAQINPTGTFTLKQTAGVAAAATLQSEEKDTAPANPSDGSAVNVYVKGDKYIIAYNHGGTMKYRYLDLTSTDATWTYTTTAP